MKTIHQFIIGILLCVATLVFAARNQQNEANTRFSKIIQENAALAALRTEALTESPKSLAYFESMLKQIEIERASIPAQNSLVTPIQ